MKKILSVIAVVGMLVGGATTVFASEAVGECACSDWAQDSIETAERIKLISGEHEFTENITRENFCELIYNYCNIFADGELTAEGENNFTDTDNAHVVFLNKFGIIAGKSDTEFAPNDLLTREEAATIIHRLIKKTSPELEIPKLYYEFNDDEYISDWARESVGVVCCIGIMQGVSNGNFAPIDNYTTEQAIATLVRVYEFADMSGESASIGIIGGADGPTAIIVGDDTTVLSKEYE